MFLKRIASLQNFLTDDQAMLISDDNNRFYFTGMRSSAGVVLITKSESFLFIDFRYYEKALSTVKNTRVILSEKLYSQIYEALKSAGVTTVFTETDLISVSAFKRLKAAFPEIRLSQSGKLTDKIKELRSIKSAEEIEKIRISQELTDRTFSYILERIEIGRTEKEIMLDMEFFMRRLGSEGTAFDFIVVSGKNSSLPHGVPTDKKIERGDFVTMDFGAVVEGYRSDMTRTVAVGEVNDRQKEVYSIVLKAQKAALEAIKPGFKCCEVDRIARDIIAEAGFEKCFGHGLGHSVGLDIHESPACNTRDNTLLKKGMIMTVEPGIYLENSFGVRIEDMVAVTADACENFTTSTKELIIL
ncbi:MAG: aminopeptidase P family protein [Clostridia bacterium]|nr:aminopeptidase P family protein [Clostridia bacterium]